MLLTVPTQQRQGIVPASAPFVVPNDAVGQIELIANITAADYEDPAHSLDMMVQVLDGAVWRDLIGFHWNGGRYVDGDGNVNPAPKVSMSPAEAYRGASLRLADINIPDRMRVGATVQTVPLV